VSRATARAVAAALDVAGDPFEALGDPNRRAIVELLAAGGDPGRSVGELAEALPISRPAVSRHLRLLKEAGLVVEEPRGTRRIYRLHDAGPEAVQAYLERVWGEASARFRLVADNPPARRGAGRAADRNAS
jgi:DNA-binding transcriptional ArsR family regulator